MLLLLGVTLEDGYEQVLLQRQLEHPSSSPFHLKVADRPCSYRGKQRAP
jgi:prophage tail gpP-like protein